MMIVVAAMMDVAMLQLARMRFAYTYHLTGEVQGLASKWMVQIYLKKSLEQFWIGPIGWFGSILSWIRVHL